MCTLVNKDDEARCEACNTPQPVEPGEIRYDERTGRFYVYLERKNGENGKAWVRLDAHCMGEGDCAEVWVLCYAGDEGAVPMREVGIKDPSNTRTRRLTHLRDALRTFKSARGRCTKSV